VRRAFVRSLREALEAAGYDPDLASISTSRGPLEEAGPDAFVTIRPPASPITPGSLAAAVRTALTSVPQVLDRVKDASVRAEKRQSVATLVPTRTVDPSLDYVPLEFENIGTTDAMADVQLTDLGHDHQVRRGDVGLELAPPLR
jgi:hypothetical protein